MKRGPLAISLGSVVVLLSLTGTACGGGDDTSAADTAAAESSTTTTAAPSTTDAPKTESGEDLSIFCPNGVAYGFGKDDYVFPHTAAHARELRAKLNLVQASAPEELDATIIAFRVMTDRYLDAMEDGTLTDDPKTVISWASTEDAEAFTATRAAQLELAAYLTANCP